jgi:AcrR family transcriptional regulator
VRPATAPSADQETRQRLLDTAAQLFAADGFRRVTVRAICRAANANVAAVNYHFGDKLGLYTAVMRTALAEMRRGWEEVRRQSEHGSAEERLRAYVRIYIRRILAVDRGAWIYQLMMQEMSEPTPLLALIVREAVQPRVDYVSGIVRELLGCEWDDPRIGRIVASVHGQCAIHRITPASSPLIGYARPITIADADEIAAHIAEFSLAGIRHVAAM